jgi:hypothetical protein
MLIEGARVELFLSGERRKSDDKFERCVELPFFRPSYSGHRPWPFKMPRFERRSSSQNCAAPV